MEELVKEWLRRVGENPDRPGLETTPERTAEAWRFLTRGYGQSIEQVVNGAIYEAQENHMVIVKDIEIFSLCEHHMLPFFGKCHIGYIPSRKIIGVSKLARIADMFARRLQIQERLTNQVADAIRTQIEPLGVGVVIEAKHLCMMMRGVEKQNSSMITSAMLGAFRRYPATRNEFLQHLRGH